MRDQLITVQILRAVAALMVVVFHVAQSWAEDLGLASANVFSMGADGVDIFFVISGFIMCYTTGEPAQRSATEFAAKRVARILPLYWGLTIGVFLLAMIAPGLLASTSANPEHLLKSLLFIPYAREDGQLFPILFLGWTLNYEMFFYAVFTFALLAGRWAHPLIIGGMALLAMLGLVLSPDGVFARFYTNDILLDFVWGCLLFLAWRRWPDVFRHLWPLAVLGFLLLVAQNFREVDLPRGIKKGLPAAMIVAGALGLSLRQSAFRDGWVKMGDASYSIYLVHPFIIELVAKALLLTLGASLVSGAILLGLSIAITIGVSLILFALWERPTNSWLRKRLLPLATRSPGARAG
jgi:exopolysaccharide production protein ExoZ